VPGEWAVGVAGALERVGTGHDVDGIDEELGGDARFALVFGEAEDAESTDHNHRGFVSRKRESPAAHARDSTRSIVTITPDPLVDTCAQRVESISLLPGHEHRTDARTQEVIGTAGAESRRALRPRRVGKRQRVLRVIPMGDAAPIG
jgi:hypothetical protein